MRPTENCIQSWDDWYKSSDYHEYGTNWIERSQNIMARAWMCNLNCAWVNKMFMENGQAEVLKRIIRKCQDWRNNIDRFSETDEYRIQVIYDESKRELFSMLTATIAEYCID